MWSLWDTPKGTFWNILFIPGEPAAGRAWDQGSKLPCQWAGQLHTRSWKLGTSALLPLGLFPSWRFLDRHLTQNMLPSVHIRPREFAAAYQTLGVPASLSAPKEQRLQGRWAMYRVLEGEGDHPPTPAECHLVSSQKPGWPSMPVGEKCPKCASFYHYKCVLSFYHCDCNQVISYLHWWMVSTNL